MLYNPLPIGTVLHKLTIIGPLVRRSYGKKCTIRFQLCKCKCGQEKYIPIFKLVGVEKYKSCGCERKINFHSRGRKRPRGKFSKYWKGYEDISSTAWWVIKNSAKVRNLLFNITIEDVWNQYLKQNGKCALTGVDIKFATTIKKYKNGEQSASLDRIDSKKGYTKDNIQWVHKIINFMKQDLSEEEFFIWCQRIVFFKKELGNVISQNCQSMQNSIAA